MIQGWRLRVEITHAEARHALADGGPLEIVHHGQPVRLTAGKPQARPIPAAPSRPRPRPGTGTPGRDVLSTYAGRDLPTAGWSLAKSAKQPGDEVD